MDSSFKCKTFKDRENNLVIEYLESKEEDVGIYMVFTRKKTQAEHVDWDKLDEKIHLKKLVK